MTALAGNARVAASEGQVGVGVVENRLTPGRFLMANFAPNSILSFVCVFRNVAGITRRVQTDPLFIDVAGDTLHTYVRAGEGIIRQVVVDGYSLPI
jgi:hypothetical protein